MLDFLVTSKTRRKLLRLLWRDHASGTATEFAARAAVSYASAYQELRKMRLMGLASSVDVEGAEVYCANENHPAAEALRGVMNCPSRGGFDEEATRAELLTLGAPLFGAPAPVEDVDDTLARSVELARHSGTVASVLPVCFFKQRGVFSPEKLVERVPRHNRRSLGFFLDLTSVLSGDFCFHKWSQRLRDHRNVGTEYFFPEDDRSYLSREVTAMNTPALAREWGLWMNMPLDAFQGMFRKHAGADHATL